MVGSAERRAVNPDDKLLPPVARDGGRGRAASPSSRTGASGEIVLWADTAASLRRLALGLGIATLIGLVLGLAHRRRCRWSRATLGAAGRGALA